MNRRLAIIIGIVVVVALCLCISVASACSVLLITNSGGGSGDGAIRSSAEAFLGDLEDGDFEDAFERGTTTQQRLWRTPAALESSLTSADGLPSDARILQVDRTSSNSIQATVTFEAEFAVGGRRAATLRMQEVSGRWLIANYDPGVTGRPLVPAAPTAPALPTFPPIRTPTPR